MKRVKKKSKSDENKTLTPEKFLLPIILTDIDENTTLASAVTKTLNKLSVDGNNSFKETEIAKIIGSPDAVFILEGFEESKFNSMKSLEEKGVFGEFKEKENDVIITSRPSTSTNLKDFFGENIKKYVLGVGSYKVFRNNRRFF